MSNDTLKAKKKLSALSSSLDDLESSLSTILSQSLPELVLGLDTIQQAKLQVVIPYLVYDLVFIYLKTKGLDPKTHPVIAELDRVRQYFDKIKDAEDPAKRQLTIDKAAATRFIKHAIAQVKDTDTAPTNVPGPSNIHTRSADDENENHDGTAHDADAPRVVVPAKMTEKMREREKYHQALREEDARSSEDDVDLEVIDDEEPPVSPSPPDNDDDNADKLPSEDPSPPRQASEFDPAGKGKGKAKGNAKAIGSPVPDGAAPSEPTVGKRRRPRIDPFAGYGDGPDTRSSTTSAEVGSTPNASRSSARIRNFHKGDVTAGVSSGTNTPSGVEHQPEDKAKKSRKRSKKKAAS